jgi:cell division protein FtsL
MARSATAAARGAGARSAPAPAPRGRPAPPRRKSARPPRRASRPATGLRRPAFAVADVALPVLRSPFARGARARGGQVLDALLSGRGWIALVFVLLAGIVFFNVDLLQLNREIAVGTERAAALKRSNASLRLELARLGSSERIQREAAAAGFVLPKPGDVLYLTATGRDARRALRAMTTPDTAPVIPPPTPAPIVEEPVVDPAAPVADDPASAPAPAAGEPAAGTEPPATTTPPATTPPAAPPAAGPTGASTAPPAG